MKITKPGVTRFFSGKLPKCPECDSGVVKWNIHKKAGDESIWQADCHCGSCGCRFEEEKSYEELFEKENIK